MMRESWVGMPVSRRSGPSRARPAPAVDGDPDAVARLGQHPADHPPRLVEPVAGVGQRRLVGEHPDQRVLLPAGEHLVQRLGLTERERQRTGGVTLAAAPPRRGRPAPRSPRATRPRSVTSPSETSIRACAPAAAARGPARHGGTGAPVVPHQRTHARRPLTEARRRRHPGQRAVGSGSPRSYRASPPPDHPSVPQTATTSPGRAPERSTGARPRRSPRAVTETTTTPGGADDRSPPDDRRPGLLGERGDAARRGRPPTPPRGRGRRRATRAARSARRPSRRCRRGSGRRP